MTNPERILIVDDDRRAREVLSGFITPLGLTPVLAEDGVSALKMMADQPPDLVLLDIMMPKMDGRQVLERIKSSPDLRHIPVIMVSALDELEIVAQCIERGADDYLVKPFNRTFLRARLTSALSRKRLHDREEGYRQQIEEYSLLLEEKVREKTKELSEAHERLKILDRAKSDFLMLISHELRTPLASVFGAAELGLFDKDLDESSRTELQGIFQTSYARLLAIVDQALLLSRIEVSAESFPVGANGLRAILDSAVELAAGLAESRGVQIEVPQDWDVQALCEKGLLTKALAALLETAVKLSDGGGTVRVGHEEVLGAVRITLRAAGKTIPEEMLPRFFEVFSVSEPITPGGDLGLGPPVAERAVKLFGGSVTVENQEPPGVLFTVTLRCPDSSEDASAARG